ncbi:MAG: DUF1641 domain-containing protein [Sulfolobaceae archaeon]
MSSLESIAKKIDDKTIKELEELLAHLEVLNEVLRKVKALKESGTLDAVINFSYLAKTLSDMLTEDAVNNISNMVSALMEISSPFSNPKIMNNYNEIISKLDVIAELLKYLKELKDSGALDAIISFGYILKTLKDMLTEDTINNIANVTSTLLELSDELNKTLPAIRKYLELAYNPVFYSIVNALTNEETQKLLKEAQNVSLAGLLRAFADPEFQRGLGIVVALVKALGRSYKI